MAIVKINGTQYRARGSFQIQPFDRSARAGRNADGTTYFTESPEISYVEAELSDAPGLALKAFQAMRGEYLTIELNNGKVYGVSNAVFEGALELNAMEGTFRARFTGDVTEVV